MAQIRLKLANVGAQGAALSSKLARFVVTGFPFTALGSAPGQMPNAYGPPISPENAKKVAAAAKNNWAVAVAIVDPSGYGNADNTQLGSAPIAVEKAATAGKFKRPTQSFQDALAKGAEN